MTITEAHHVMNVIRVALGREDGASDDQVRLSFSYLAERAGKALQVTIKLDGHDIDAAIVRRRGGAA